MKFASQLSKKKIIIIRFHSLFVKKIMKGFEKDNIQTQILSLNDIN